MLPAVLAVTAAAADSGDARAVALYALLAALPFAAVSALVCFGDYVETREDAVAGVQALLWAVAVVLLVVSCAVRSQADGIPAAGESALVACLGVFAVKLALAAAPLVRRIALRPAKP